MNRWLIEFDVRLAKEEYVSRRWDSESRTNHLLRPEVEWPLSVDKWIWPSVFFSKNFKDPKFDAFATIAVDQSVERARCWLHLEEMRVWYNAHRALAPGGVFVGIELLSEKAVEGTSLLYESPDGIQCGIWLDPTVPDRIPEGSILLGFDVATATQFSGLTDFGYSKEEVSELGPVWAPRLNSFGLLSTLEDAIAFTRLSDGRVPEEAPFWVHALWQLPG